MVAVQNIILALVTGAVMVEAGASGQLSVGGKVGMTRREIVKAQAARRGTTNVWAREAPLDAGAKEDAEEDVDAITKAFPECIKALEKTDHKTDVKDNGDGTYTVTQFPDECQTEAEDFMESSDNDGVITAVKKGEIKLKAPSEAMLDMLKNKLKTDSASSDSDSASA